MARTLRLISLAGLLFAPAQAHAQYRPGLPPGYPAFPPGYVGGYNPGRYGGMLHGSADVTRATGDLMVQQEQARITREQAEQAKLDTRRKAFDEAMYEKANTPTYVERERASQIALFQRVLIKPTSTEVTTGRAHNIMLPELDRMALAGVFGSPVALDPAQLKLVNVTLPGKAGMSMLGDPGNIAWPIALVGPTQEKYAATLEKAVDIVRTKGRIDPKTYMEVQTGFKVLRGELDKKFDDEKINMSRFAEASTFMQNLNKEIASLSDPAANKMLTAVGHPQASDVLELVAYMMTKGLQFGPARPGDESAYYSLHNAMSVFAQSQQSGLSQAPGAPPSGAPPRKK